MLHQDWELEQMPKHAEETVDCHWPSLRSQILGQWKRVTLEELDATGSKRYKIALLIQQKHGVSWQLVQNYLMNIERSLPLFG